VALEVGEKVMRDNQVSKFLWLLPLRDVLALATWMASFAGSTVVWRGEKFTVRDGKLRRIASINS